MFQTQLPDSLTGHAIHDVCVNAEAKELGENENMGPTQAGQDKRYPSLAGRRTLIEFDRWT